MGLFDSLTSSLEGALSSVTAAQDASVLPGLLQNTNLGSLQGIVTQLQANGLGGQVQSWLGSGQNLPVTPEQIQAALGSDAVKQIAQHFGIDPEAAAKLLAQHLPAVIDQASPNGSAPAA